MMYLITRVGRSKCFFGIDTYSVVSKVQGKWRICVLIVNEASQSSYVALRPFGCKYVVLSQDTQVQHQTGILSRYGTLLYQAYN